MKNENNKGFSLVELLVAVTVLAIITVPLLRSFVTSANVAARSRQMGNATIAGRNLAEIVESNDISYLLENADAVFGAGDVSYDDDIDIINKSDAVQVITLKGVTGGDASFDARVTLSAADYKDRNDQAMSQYGDMDHVFNQSRDTDDPDQMAWDDFKREVDALPSGWDSTNKEKNNKIERNIVLTITQDEDGKVWGDLQFLYTFTYTSYVTEFPNGVETKVPYVAEFEPTMPFTRKLWNFGWDYNTEQRYPNIYLMYYPMYDKGDVTAYEVTGDNITINNKDNVPFKLFLVKKKEPGANDTELSTWETNYKSAIIQDLGDLGTSQQNPAEVYSNAKEPLIKSAVDQKLINVSYKIYYNTYFGDTASFAGEENTLVGQTNKNHLYRVNVQIFPSGTSFADEDVLYTFTTTKLQ